MKKLLTVISLLLASAGIAQRTGQALHVGDQMPAYTFPSVIRYPKKSMNLNAFRGKFVILDFWFTRCSSCIASFPDMQKLQDQFKDRIQLIAVNDEKTDDWDRINKTLANFEKKSGVQMHIPFALFDSAICNYFPHKAAGLHVIIDPKGKIVAITNPRQVTPENIQAILDGKKVNFLVQDDFFNPNVPLATYLNRNNLEGLLHNSSLIVMNNKSLPGGLLEGPIYNEKGQTAGYRRISSLVDAYSNIYPGLFKGSPIIEYRLTDSTINENTFLLYEYILRVQPHQPADTNVYLYDLTQKDLRESLDQGCHLSLRRTKALYPCVVVKTNDKISNSHTATADPNNWDTNLDFYELAIKKNTPIYMHNWDVRTITTSLSRFFHVPAAQVVIESDNKDNLDIDFPAGFDFNKPEKIIAFLHEKGIDLSLENRELDCLIMSDKKQGEPTVLN